jgi:hypothetical protein
VRFSLIRLSDALLPYSLADKATIPDNDKDRNTDKIKRYENSLMKDL